MRQRAIDPYQVKLRDVLMEHGWTIEQAELFQNDLWFVDMWRLVSLWSPAGLPIFLTFEFDDHFYSVAASVEQPHDHRETDWKSRVYLKRGWERDLPVFLDDLDALRTTLA